LAAKLLLIGQILVSLQRCFAKSIKRSFTLWGWLVLTARECYL